MEDFKQHYRQHRATYLLIGALIVFIIGWGTAHTIRTYLAGHGSVVIQDVPTETLVQVDGRTIQYVEEGVSTIQTDLAPGEHTITLGRERHWPWSKTLTIEQDMTATVTPFLISQLSVRAPIEPEHSERPIVERLFADTSRATREQPIRSSDEMVALWHEEGAIIAEWNGGTTTTPHFFCRDTCLSERTILTTPESIQHIAFLGDRNDVVVLASTEGIFALELDTRDTQNFQPILEGTNLNFRVRDHESLYVTNGSSFFTITL